MTSARDEKYRAILNSAIDVFFRRGFVAGTTREIAELVGLTQPAIYFYFGTKNDLLDAVALTMRDRLGEAFTRGAAQGDAPEERLQGIVHEYTNAVILNRKACAVYWDERKHISPSVATEVREAQRGYLRTVQDLVRQAQEQGKLAPGEPPVVAEAILGMVTWTYRWYRDDGTLNPSDIAKVFCGLLGLPVTSHRPRKFRPRT